MTSQFAGGIILPYIRRETMQKYVTNALANYNFVYSGNYGYGRIDGYEVNVYNNPVDTGPIFLFSTYLSQMQKNEFIVAINQLKISLVQADAFDFGVMVKIGAMTGRQFEKKIPNVIEQILRILQELEAPKANVCPQSGEVLAEDNCKIITLPNSNYKICLTSNAIETVNSGIEKSNEDFQNAPNNYLKGFIGIAIGAIAGVAVAFIAGLMGYITSFAPLVSIFLGVFLYKKFGGKQNYMMIVMSLGTTLVAIVGYLLALYIIVANQAVAEINLSMSGFEALRFCLENSDEFKQAFVSEITTNAIFFLVAGGVSVGNLLKMVRRPQNIQ